MGAFLQRLQQRQVQDGHSNLQSNSKFFAPQKAHGSEDLFSDFPSHNEPVGRGRGRGRGHRRGDGTAPPDGGRGNNGGNGNLMNVFDLTTPSQDIRPAYTSVDEGCLGAGNGCHTGTSACSVSAELITPLQLASLPVRVRLIPVRVQWTAEVRPRKPCPPPPRQRGPVLLVF